MSDEHRPRPVAAFDALSGRVLRTWPSAAAAERSTGVSHMTLVSDCDGRRWPVGGTVAYRWADELDPAEPYSSAYKPVAAIRATDAKCVAAWPSKTAAAAGLGTSIDRVRGAISRRAAVATGWGRVYLVVPVRPGMVEVGRRLGRAGR